MSTQLGQHDYDKAVDALLHGPGYYLFEGVFDEREVAAANEIINAHSDSAQSATHFHGEHSDKIHLQRRVWNLLNKGEVFINMVQHPAVMAVFSRILGKQFILGSYAANRLLPGAPAQEAHVDYPYWDMHDESEFPIGINSSFHMNCQSLINLHEFTEENGATAVVPNSQGRGRYPDQEQFEQEMVQLCCPAGSLLLFVGMLWHRSMANNSQADRTSVLGQYLPKFVKPMERLEVSVAEEVVSSASPQLRQLLGLDLRYPELLEESAAGNAEGATA